MKNVRKRQLLKVMKLNATKLMKEYFHHEHAMIIAGIRTISEEREMTILNTLSGYAHVLDRNFPLYTGVYEEEWILAVSDFY